MGQRLTLTADDGHSLGAYRADASGRARGGIVVLQEIFGVNSHIRSVCDGFAADGFTCIAPALYDRSSHRDCELGYEAGDMAAGVGEFRDAHGLVDHGRNPHEVSFQVRARRRHRITLDPELYDRLETAAVIRGFSPETLVDRWVTEKLQAVRPRAIPPDSAMVVGRISDPSRPS